MLKTVSLSLEVLKMFTKERQSWSGKELALAMNENHTKIYRVLETLKNHNFLVKDDIKKQYSLGFAIWELNNVLSENIQFEEVIHPILEELSNTTHESTFLIVADKNEAFILDAVESKSDIRFSVSKGSRTPLYAGASYRSILAFKSKVFISNYLENLQLKQFTHNTPTNIKTIKKDLDSINKKGYAISTGELTRDVTAVAVPIFYKSRVVASLTISGPTYRVDEEKEQYFVKTLFEYKQILEDKFEKYGFGIKFY